MSSLAVEEQVAWSLFVQAGAELYLSLPETLNPKTLDPEGWCRSLAAAIAGCEQASAPYPGV